jgi:hypothetical protein
VAQFVGKIFNNLIISRVIGRKKMFSQQLIVPYNRKEYYGEDECDINTISKHLIMKSHLTNRVKPSGLKCSVVAQNNAMKGEFAVSLGLQAKKRKSKPERERERERERENETWSLKGEEPAETRESISKSEVGRSATVALIRFGAGGMESPEAERDRESAHRA